MQLYDNIKLIDEIEELAQKGIHRGYLGTVVKCYNDSFIICFYNPKNLGEYAFAEVNKKSVEFVIRPEEKIIFEMEAFVSSVKMERYTHLTECDVKEYDAVELIVEKSKYTIEGVHKGDRGCVISRYAIDNHWEIIFSERGTGKDIAQIGVDRADFKIIDEV